MTTPDVEGGVTLDSFEVIDEFVRKCQAGTLDDNDRQVHGSHPLALLLEGTLEAVSRANLSLPIIGLSRRAEALLVEERRQLEDKNARPALQQFLFSFEPLCEIVREAGYGGGDEGDAERFFEDLFPEWLQRLTAWAASETLTALADRVAAARTTYVGIAADIVTEP